MLGGGRLLTNCGVVSGESLVVGGKSTRSASDRIPIGQFGHLVELVGT